MNLGDQFVDTVGKLAGFSLHAGVAARARQQKIPQRSRGAPPCRYIGRPAVFERRLTLRRIGNQRYQ